MTHMIGANTLDKPAVGVSYQKGRAKVVGEQMAAIIPMDNDSIHKVMDHRHWVYHDTLYHADEEYPNESCDVCEEFGETAL